MLFAFVYPNCAPKTSEILRKHILTNIVKVEDRNGQLYVIGIIEESGHSTIRIVFFDKTIIQQTENELIRLGCDFEGSDNPNLIAIDITQMSLFEKEIEFAQLRLLGCDVPIDPDLVQYLVNDEEEISLKEQFESLLQEE